MLETFLATLEPMVAVFLFILVGFVLRKGRLAPENTGFVLSRLVNYVFLPAQVFVTFMTYCTPASLAENYRYLLYSTLCLALGLVMAYPLSKWLANDPDHRGIYRYALVFANYGYLGYAIIPDILGPEFLYPYMLFTLPVNVLAFAWGMNQMIPQGQKRINPLKRLLNPVLISMFAGAVVGLTGAGKYLPNLLRDLLGDMSACMGPLAMILTGFIIGGYRLRELMGDKAVYIMTFLRLTVLPAILLAVMYLLGADGSVMTMVLVAFGAALGVNTVVFTAAYGGDTKPGAAMAMISHIFAVISIPLMYALLTQLVKR